MTYGTAFGNERSTVCGYHAHVDLGGCFRLGQPCCVCDQGYVGTPESGCLDESGAGNAAAVAAAIGCRSMGGTPTSDGDCVMPGETPPRPPGCPECPTAKVATCPAPPPAPFSWSALALGALLGLAGGVAAARYVARRGAT